MLRGLDVHSAQYSTPSYNNYTRSTIVNRFRIDFSNMLPRTIGAGSSRGQDFSNQDVDIEDARSEIENDISKVRKSMRDAKF